jgi:hypothetical protein
VSFATLARNRTNERLLSLAAAVSLILSMMVVFAEPAWAHHPTITATEACENGKPIINYTSTSWLTTGASGSDHNDIRIQVSVNGGAWTEVDNGAYNAGNGYSFSGSFPADELWGETIQVRAWAEGNWVNGAAPGNGHPDSITAAFLVDQDCFNPSCPSGYLEVKVDPAASGTFGPNDEFTISIGSGDVFDWTSTVPVYQVIVKGGPGANVFNYDGDMGGTGLHAPDNPKNDKYYGLSHITFCYQEAPDDVPVEVSVTAGVCEVVQGVPAGTADVVIDPASGATVEIYQNSDFTGLIDTLTSSGTVSGLSPGTYYWRATAADGHVIEGQSQGQFTVEPCAASVVIVAEPCTTDDQGLPQGSVSITVDPASGATVTVYDDAGMTNEVLSTSTSSDFPLAPGTYYWQATPGTGFDLTGDTSGQFTIDPCESSVSVAADGVCEVDGQGNPVGEVTITIDPDSSATLVVYSDAGMTTEVLNTSTGGTFDLAPGTYYWEATAGPGFGLTGDGTGQFTIDPCEVTFEVAGVCDNPDGLPVGQGILSVTMSVPQGAVVEFEDANGASVGSLDESGSINVPQGASYSWVGTPNTGFAFPDGFVSEGSLDIEDCGDDEVLASILYTVDGVCHATDEVGVINVTVSVAGGAEVVVSNSAGEVVGTLTQDGTLTVPDGDTYTWVATPAPGFVFPPGTSATGSLTIGDCADEVLASIVVTVGSVCDLVGDEGVGRITVTMSVAGGADVVVRNSDGDVVGTLSGDGTIQVPEGDVYTWAATPNPGFEFPAGFDSTGSVTVETCSNPAELPFTGLHSDEVAALGILMLIVGGFALLTSSRSKPEQS